MNRPTFTNGQPMGERGLRTRQRILDAIAVALEERGPRGLRIADIAAEVEFSPGAFYQYFRDLDHAILTLCEEVGAALPSFEPSIDPHGGGADAKADAGADAGSTRGFVDDFLAYWNAHRAVLTSRNVAIDSGDPRFAAVQGHAFQPVMEALQLRIKAAQQAGHVDPSIRPHSLAAVILSMLERVAMVEPQIVRPRGADPAKDLAAAVAYALDRMLGTVGGS